MNCQKHTEASLPLAVMVSDGRLVQLSAMVQGLPCESVHAATSLGGGEEAGGLCSQAAGSGGVQQEPCLAEERGGHDPH